MRVAGNGAERPAAGQSLPARVAPVGAAKAAGPSVTAGRSPNAEGAQARRLAGSPIEAGRSPRKTQDNSPSREKTAQARLR